MDDMDSKMESVEWTQSNGSGNETHEADRLAEFLNELRRGLTGVPKETADDAIRYYEEYVADARLSGVKDDDILFRVGSVNQVVRSIHDELDISATHSRPSASRLLKTSRKVFGKGAARAFQGTSFAFLSIFPLVGSFILYLATFVLSLGAVSIVAGIVFSILRHRDLATADIISQAGLAAAIASVFLLSSLAFRLAANAMARATLSLFRKASARPRLSNSSEAPGDTTGASSPSMSPPKPRNRFAKVLAVLLLITLTSGLILSFVYGLPQQYFRLWNSNLPSQVEPVSLNFNVGVDSISKLTINGLNANLTLLPADDGQFRLTYDKAPYVRLDWSLSGQTLQLEETANGKLPFFDWLAIHKGTAGLTVFLPGNTGDLELDIETKGGDVFIRIPVNSGKIRTINGDITVLVSEDNASLDLLSRNGLITYMKK